jgi:hypothetical protein
MHQEICLGDYVKATPPVANGTNWEKAPQIGRVLGFTGAVGKPGRKARVCFIWKNGQTGNCTIPLDNLEFVYRP